MSASATARIIDLFRDLGGTLDTPRLRPGSWDLAFTNGLVIELDEELHFNRYRHLTLDHGLPWSEDYAVNAVSREAECLAAGRWGRRWSSPSTEAMFGPGDASGTLGALGSPRWKQRALYDAMKDSVSEIALARLSIYDSLGSVSLGQVLEHRADFDPDRLAQLVAERTRTA